MFRPGRRLIPRATGAWVTLAVREAPFKRIRFEISTWWPLKLVVLYRRPVVRTVRLTGHCGEAETLEASASDALGGG